MEIVGRSEDPQHRHAWLERLGLEASTPGPDSWVPVARACEVDEVATRSSSAASQLVAALDRAGIEAKPHPYQFDKKRRGILFPEDHMVARVAVLVQHRDLERAVQVATDFERDLTAEQQRGEHQPLVSEEELTREALEAGPPPEE